MMRKCFIAMLAVMIMPALAMAVDGNKFVMAKPVADQTGEIVVPIEISNTQDLVALDIPLGFSEGASLEKVEFTDLVQSFDFKIARIENEERLVLIGLVTMGKKDRPDLPTGSGTIANLYFKLEPGVEMVEITPIELKRPDHQLAYYYNDFSNGYPEVRVIYPEVQTVQYSLAPEAGAVPDVYALSQNSPNPFNPTTKLSYSIPEAGQVRLTIFNILGQNVRELVNDYREAGTYDVVWDGQDNYGQSVASGIYFYRMDAGSFSETRKMMLIK